jgi:hypothetical protein
VAEGIDEEGRLYLRWREWATRKGSGKFGHVEMPVPDDFMPQGWGPAYVPESSDTLEDVLARLDQLVEDGILTADEQARREGFNKRLFQVKTLQYEPYYGETPLGIMLNGGYGDVD